MCIFYTAQHHLIAATLLFNKLLDPVYAVKKLGGVPFSQERLNSQCCNMQWRIVQMALHRFVRWERTVGIQQSSDHVDVSSRIVIQIELHRQDVLACTTLGAEFLLHHLRHCQDDASQEVEEQEAHD